MKKTMLSICLGGLMIASSCTKADPDDHAPDKANFKVTIENIAPVKPFITSGVFNTPVGDTAPGAATPGKKFEFTINAGRSQHLSFATMLAATNDLFYGPNDDGIALYDDDGTPISGDVTDQVYLWDAGTEINEEPAVGPNTVTNQLAPNTGPDENGNIMAIADVTNGVAFDYPTVPEVVHVMIKHVSGTEFKVTIEDQSTAILKTSQGDRPAPLSPGAWVVYSGDNPLYTIGEPDFGHGVESIAEDGDATSLGDYVVANTGVTYPASPGGWVLYEDGTKPLFTEGMLDYGDGIEAIAEDGDASVLGSNIPTLDGEKAGEVFNMPVGSSSPGPILPGSKYEFTFEARAGDNLSFATMLAATNDVFFAPNDEGIALFDSDGDPINGDVTDQVYLWDAGTEVNEQPGLGPNTVTNQLAPNTGNDENQPVQLLSNVNDGFTYPAVNAVLKVTLTSN